MENTSLEFPSWLHRIKVPIPIESLKYINVYMISDSNSFSLIDSGMYNMRSFHELSREIKKNGYKINEMESVIVTHFHVDHITLSPVLYSLGASDFYLGLKDEKVLRRGFDKFITKALKIYINHGMPPSEANEISKFHPAMKLVDVYTNDLQEIPWITMSNDSEIDLYGIKFKIIEVPGHTPGQINLYNKENDIIFTGDHILDPITPQITLTDENTDPLGDYLSSLEKISSLNAKIAFPGHKEPILNPSKRAKEIIKHHEERLNEIMKLISKNSLTAYEIAKKVKWRASYNSWEEYPYPERFFAMGETLAHLKRLEKLNLVEKKETKNVYTWSII
ncbi:Zn-dependent hydrolase, glyoxylase [Caldisphaera lagunensis DSM 15908]|uniref:Zn-dependent hydrolase, glyoxylase n=1 Tax=Caldisphaera lagunensis (strain DSM 15908 / JCM 11604 / ANMR 0165 / IC-154) TaxID=1056495 RepID=L0ACE4_CALLD|nr:MBL fold metallo-hydrolase [Caldisphaera lagunensis]AFZ70807.1 Zn-dependent hydrolase, glyoxylase [Caldisphaera lagunensis DSM 15908]